MRSIVLFMIVVTLLSACVPRQQGLVKPDEVIVECPPSSEESVIASRSFEAGADDETPAKPEPLPDPLVTRLARLEAKIDGVATTLATPNTPSSDSEASAACTGTESQTAIGDAPMKTTVGAMEWIKLDPPERWYQARIDSGARRSALGASNMVEFERDGEAWVRFELGAGTDEEPITVERPIIREVRLRNGHAERGDRRPMVSLAIRLGDQVQRTEFVLGRGEDMLHSVVLGREFLRDIYLIDVSQTYALGEPEAL